METFNVDSFSGIVSGCGSLYPLPSAARDAFLIILDRALIYEDSRISLEIILLIFLVSHV